MSSPARFPRQSLKLMILLIGLSVLLISLLGVVNHLFMQRSDARLPVPATRQAAVFPHEVPKLGKEEEEQNEEDNLTRMRNDPDLVQMVQEYTRQHPLAPYSFDKDFDRNNRTRQITPNLSVGYPASVDEASISKTAQEEQTAFALHNLNPQLFELFYRHYGQDSTAMMDGFGIKRQCNSRECQYSLADDSPLISATRQQMQPGDTITQINRRAVASIGSMDDLKQTLFSRNPVIVDYTTPGGAKKQISLPLRAAL